MFPFPQAPTGGRGGMTANQVPQPMAQQQSMPTSPLGGAGGMMPAMQGMQSLMPQGGMQAPPQPMAPGLGMQQNPPISPSPAGGAGGVDPQQLALLRLLLEQQQHPTGNLQALLGL